MPDTLLPAADFFSDAGRTNGEAKQGQDDLLAYLRERLGNTDGLIDLGAREIRLGNINGGPLGFRNLILNGDFRFNQRGSASYSAGGYTLDRWRSDVSAGTALSQVAVASAAVDGATFGLKVEWAAAPSGNFRQRIENLRQFAGLPVTISFHAMADAAVELECFIQYDYGSGGSAAENVETSTHDLTTDWQRFSHSFTASDFNAKSFGSAHNLGLIFGSSNMANRTLYLTNVQVEIGTRATPFERRPDELELALCRRFYEKTQQFFFRGPVSGQAHYTPIFWKVRKRTTPTVTPTFTYTNSASGAVVNLQTDGAEVQHTPSAINGWAAVVCAVDAEL